MPDRHLLILPILIPFTGALIAILLRDYPRLRAYWSLAVMFLSLIFSSYLFISVWKNGITPVFQIGGWPAPFGITLLADLLSAVFVFMSQLVLVLGVLYALGSKDKCVGYPAFYPLFLFLAGGLSGGLLTGDIFNLFVFVELMAVSGTVLTAISDDRYGTEAAYKYFYMSQLAAVFLLLAVGSLYVSYGTLNMGGLSAAVAGEPEKAMPGAAFLMAVFMIKSATFPFHFWQPDFHTAAPTPVSAMLSSVVVKFGVYGFIRMTTLLFAGHSLPIQELLIVLGIIGIVFGGLSAMGTHNVKRMLAYSTWAQVGFILVGIGWNSPLSLTAAIVFSFNHSLIKSAMLMLAGYVASRASVKSASFDIVRGVGKSLPLAGGLFFIGGLGLSGIPPTNGFISKMLIFRSGIHGAQYWELLFMGLAGILTLVYSIRAFQCIWWENTAEGIYCKDSGDCLIAPLILIALVLVFGIWADPLVEVAQEAAFRLGNPGACIQAVSGG